VNLLVFLRELFLNAGKVLILFGLWEGWTEGVYVSPFDGTCESGGDISHVSEARHGAPGTRICAGSGENGRASLDTPPFR
jgi:hypothetical protein